MLCIEWSPAANAKSNSIRTKTNASRGRARDCFTVNTYLPLRWWWHDRRRVVRRRLAAMMLKRLEMFEVACMTGRHELGEER